MLMNYRWFSLCVVALAVFTVGATFATKEAKDVTHDGEVVSITGNKLVMTNQGEKDGQEHAHMLASDAALTLDGKACKASDLKSGMRIRVTTRIADKRTANRVEGLDKNPAFASTRQEGIVVSVNGNKLAMTEIPGKEDRIHILSANVKVTCDGKSCKSSDLKPGMKIRVTLESNSPYSASEVESLDKNPEFPTL